MAFGDNQTSLIDDQQPHSERDIEAQEEKPKDESTRTADCLEAGSMSINNILFTLNMLIGGMVISSLPDANENSAAAGGVINTTQTWVFVTLQVTLFCMNILISSERSALKKLTDKQQETELTEEEEIKKQIIIKRINDVMKAGKVLAALLSVPGSLAMYYAGDLLALLGQPSGVVDEVTPYFRIMAAAFPIMMYVETNKQVAFGLAWGWLHNSMAFLNLLTIGFGYCLMTGALFSIKMGIPGLATGYLISHFINGIVFNSCYQYRPYYKDFDFSVVNWCSPTQTYRNIVDSWTTVKELWGIGWPILINLFSELFAVYMTNVFAAWLKNPEQAESMNEVVTQFSFLFIIIQVGLTNAATPITSNLLKKDPQSVRRMGHIIMGLGFTIATVVLVASLIFTRQFSSGYIKEGVEGYDSMMHQLKSVLPTMMGIQIADAIRNISIGVLRGFLDTSYPMYVSVFTQMGISMAGCAIGTFVIGKSLEAITVGYGAGILVGMVLVYKRFLEKTSQENLERLADQANQHETVTHAEPEATGYASRLTSCFGIFKPCFRSNSAVEDTELDNQAQYKKMGADRA